MTPPAYINPAFMMRSIESPDIREGEGYYAIVRKGKLVEADFVEDLAGLLRSKAKTMRGGLGGPKKAHQTYVHLGPFSPLRMKQLKEHDWPA